MFTAMLDGTQGGVGRLPVQPRSRGRAEAVGRTGGRPRRAGEFGLRAKGIDGAKGADGADGAAGLTYSGPDEDGSAQVRARPRPAAGGLRRSRRERREAARREGRGLRAAEVAAQGLSRGARDISRCAGRRSARRGPFRSDPVGRPRSGRPVRGCVGRAGRCRKPPPRVAGSPSPAGCTRTRCRVAGSTRPGRAGAPSQHRFGQTRRRAVDADAPAADAVHDFQDPSQCRVGEDRRRLQHRAVSHRGGAAGPAPAGCPRRAGRSATDAGACAAPAAASDRAGPAVRSRPPARRSCGRGRVGGHGSSPGLDPADGPLESGRGVSSDHRTIAAWPSPRACAARAAGYRERQDSLGSGAGVAASGRIDVSEEGGPRW